MVTRRIRYLVIGIVLLIPFVGLAESNTEPVALPLDEAIALSLEQHADIRQAELDLRIAQLQLKAAWAQSTVPSIGLQMKPPDLSAGKFAEDIQGTFGIGVSLPWGTQSSLSAEITLDWNRVTGEWADPGWGITYVQQLDLAQLDAGFEALTAKQQAVSDAKETLERARHTVVLDTIDAYSDLLSAQAQLVQAQADLKRAETGLDAIKEHVEAGLKGDASLLEAQLAVLEARIILEQIETAYAADKETFGRVTLGISEAYEPVALELALDNLTAAATELVTDEEIPEAPVLVAREVLAAQEKLTDAKDALRTAQTDALPELSLQAGIDETGWRIGWGISLDLFESDRFLQIDIAKANVELAGVQLETTQERVTNSILSLQTTLLRALDDLDRLPLEGEKWALEEQVMHAKREAGTISEQEWEEFLEDKEAFDLSKDERAASLLLAYLAYRDGLGLKLEWEEWLQ